MRLSGDEFAVLLRTDADGGMQVAERTQEALGAAYPVPGGVVHLTVSIGLRAWHGRANAGDALREADVALYAARAAGGNQIVVYDAALHADRLKDTRMVAELRQALAGGEFTMYYQPIVDLTTGRVAATEALLRWIRPLREHGIRIAIDDFGTGYSSLSYLRQLPVDILKMDGSFTTGQIETGDPRDIALIRALVQLATSLGLRTIAEAVETGTQAQCLHALDCDLAQGYHFYRPAPVAALHTVLNERGSGGVAGPAEAAPATA